MDEAHAGWRHHAHPHADLTDGGAGICAAATIVLGVLPDAVMRFGDLSTFTGAIVPDDARNDDGRMTMAEVVSFETFMDLKLYGERGFYAARRWAAGGEATSSLTRGGAAVRRGAGPCHR